MKYGVVMRTDIDLDLISAIACDAEKYGWDGFLVWDGFLGPNPWILLAIVSPFIEAGATLWLENVAITPYRLGGVEGVRTRTASSRLVG